MYVWHFICVKGREELLMRVLLTAVAQHGGVIRSEYSILYGAVAFIFVVSGLQLSPEKLRKNVTNWRLHILVHGISFAVIPATVLGKFTLSIVFV
jgi:sodium/bile acid cotransporter 7